MNDYKHPLISIIVPVYNASAYIGRCIESILNQSYKNIELILVNDASTDNSLDIINSYLHTDERIRLIDNKRNLGETGTRNEGIKAATGEYLGFVDADDWIHSDMYSTLYDNIIQQNADIACCSYFDSYPDTCKAKSNSNRLFIYSQIDALKTLHQKTYIFPYMCNKLFKASIAKTIEPTNVFVGGDYSFVVPAILKSQKIVFIDTPLYYYFHHSHSICAAGYSKKRAMVIKNYSRIRKTITNIYPELDNDVLAYDLVEEMAVVTAMVRNNTYNRRVTRYVRNHIKKHAKLCLTYKYYGFSEKIAAISIIIHPQLFYLLYRILMKISR